MKKKRLFILLVFVAAASLLYGGGSAQPTSRPSSKKIRVEVFERGTAGLNAADNFMTRWIQENYGVKNGVEIEYVPIPRSQEVDMLNILMSANNAPDLCFTYDQTPVSNYAQNGGLVDLESYLQSSNGQKLVDYLTPEVLAYGVWGGKQYALPARRTSVGQNCTYVRKDWLDKLGLKVPSTRQEFYDMLVAFKQRDPGGFGSATIPMAMDAYEVDISAGAPIILDTFMEPITPQQLASYPEFYRPGVKEGLRFLNKLYHEGLISPNFALDKDYSQYTKDIASGKVGAIIRSPPNWIYGARSIELERTIPEALFVPCDPFENSQGIKAKRGYLPIGFYIFIPKTCKDPQLVIDYMAWMTDPDIRLQIKSGVEGIHYEGLQNGIPYGSKPIADLPNEYKHAGGDLCVIISGDDYGSQEKNDQALIMGNPKYGPYIVEAYRIAVNGRFVPPPITTPIASEAAYGATVRAKGNELYVRSIMAPPNQFDTVFDSYLKEYMDIGGKRIMDEKMAAYAAEHP
jgi:putative aldouronate transport system substrate-binding protein